MTQSNSRTYRLGEIVAQLGGELVGDPGVEIRRIATLETELRTPEERGQWLAVRGPKHPVFVAMETSDPEGTIVGWGSLNVYNARPAYQYVADFSISSSAGGGERAWAGGCSSTSSSRRAISATTR